MRQKKFGELLKALRIDLGLTQVQLAEGICTDRQIKNIETGRSSPSLELVSALTRKLGASIYEIVVLADTNISVHQYKSAIELRKLYKAHDFIQLKERVMATEAESTAGETPYLLQLIKWYKGICLGAVDGDYEQCKQALIEAWTISYPDEPLVIGNKYLTETEIHIIISYASNVFINHQVKEALALYLDVLSFLEHHQHTFEAALYTRVIYNVGRCYMALQQYEQALEKMTQAIKCATDVQSFDMLAEALYIQGEAYMKLGQKAMGQKVLKKAIYLSECVGKGQVIRTTKAALSLQYGIEFDKAIE